MSNELDFLSLQVAKGRFSRRDFLGRAAALGLSAGGAGMLLTNTAIAAGPQRGGTMKVGLSGGSTTDSLDPALAASSVTVIINRSWGEELVALTADGRLEPKLATEWAASLDATEWTFTIRSGVQFHNGKTLTPDDVVATIERHSGPDTKSGALGIMREIKSVKSNGDSVVFYLKNPNADLPYLLNDYHLLIQPNGGKDDPAAGIGTGPYKRVSSDAGVRYVGERFENYWAKDARGHAAEIEILILNDSTARLAALQSGRVDMINRVDTKVMSFIDRIPSITTHSVPGRGHYLLIAHCNSAPYDNNDLRLALKFAIDREEMVDKILQGFGTIGNDSPINAAYPLYSEALPQRPFDTDRAAFHYKKSGNKEPLLLRTSDVAFPGAIDAAQLFQASCAKAGIPIEVRREPGDGYWNQTWNKQPFCMSYWEGRPIQDQMFSTAYVSNADWNESRFFHPSFDKMAIAARGELDQAKRTAIYRDMSLMVQNQGGSIIPMFNDNIAAVGQRIQGWKTNPNLELMDSMAPSECWLKA